MTTVYPDKTEPTPNDWFRYIREAAKQAHIRVRTLEIRHEIETEAHGSRKAIEALKRSLIKPLN